MERTCEWGCIHIQYGITRFSTTLSFKLLRGVATAKYDVSSCLSFISCCEPQTAHVLQHYSTAFKCARLTFFFFIVHENSVYFSA